MLTNEYLVSHRVLLLRYSVFFALKACGLSLIFLICNINTQNGYYKKGRRHLVANFSAAILPNIIKTGQHLQMQEQITSR